MPQNPHLRKGDPLRIGRIVLSLIYPRKVGVTITIVLDPLYTMTAPHMPC